MAESLSQSAYSPEFGKELVLRLGKIFARMRCESNTPLLELSKRTGIAASQIEEFEAGSHDIDIDALIKLLDGIKVSMVDLFNNFENSPIAAEQ
ncbi:MAG TPA: helix-turn-helix transcriptional regulator [Drouetiella sp.]